MTKNFVENDYNYNFLKQKVEFLEIIMKKVLNLDFKFEYKEKRITRILTR